MKFRKIFAIALCALTFTACSNDDDKDLPINRTEGEYYGGFTVNQGNQGNNIPGSLTNIDYETGEAHQNAFRTANKRVLGDTPQSAIIFGDKMYIAVYMSNTIEIVNKTTLKSEKTISLTGTGTQPRYMTGKGNYVYVSMFDGYVSRIDTRTLEIDKTIKVGPNPDELAIAGDYLYVTNSDGMNYLNGYADGFTVSKINLSTFTEEKKITVGMNPTKAVSNGKDVFVICMGDYSAENPATLMRINTADDSVEKLFGATLMTINGNNLYTVNAPATWGSLELTAPTYSVYSISDKKKTDLKLENIIQPIAIGVEPKSGHIFISSYSVENGWSDPCVVNEYAASGSFLKSYNAGIGASCLVF